MIAAGSKFPPGRNCAVAVRYGGSPGTEAIPTTVTRTMLALESGSAKLSPAAKRRLHGVVRAARRAIGVRGKGGSELAYRFERFGEQA